MGMDISRSMMNQLRAAQSGQSDGKIENLAKEISPKGSKDAKEASKIRALAQDFESIFMESMLSSMRKTVTKSGLIDGGNAEEIYQSMLDSEYAKIMSAQRATGIANAIENYMIAAQGGGPKPPTRVNTQGAQARNSTDGQGVQQLQPELKQARIGTK